MCCRVILFIKLIWFKCSLGSIFLPTLLFRHCKLMAQFDCKRFRKIRLLLSLLKHCECLKSSISWTKDAFLYFPAACYSVTNFLITLPLTTIHSVQTTQSAVTNIVPLPFLSINLLNSPEAAYIATRSLLNPKTKGPVVQGRSYFTCGLVIIHTSTYRALDKSKRLQELLKLPILTDRGLVSARFLRIDSQSGLSYLYLSCLLYTSPSPRDDNRSRMPSSA